MRFIHIPTQSRNSWVKPNRITGLSTANQLGTRQRESLPHQANSELIEQICNRDHHSSDHAAKQKKQKIIQEDRHAPPSALCWGELNNPRNCLGMVSDTWLQNLQTVRWDVERRTFH